MCVFVRAQTRPSKTVRATTTFLWETWSIRWVFSLFFLHNNLLDFCLLLRWGGPRRKLSSRLCMTHTIKMFLPNTPVDDTRYFCAAAIWDRLSLVVSAVCRRHSVFESWNGDHRLDPGKRIETLSLPLRPQPTNRPLWITARIERPASGRKWGGCYSLTNVFSRHFLYGTISAMGIMDLGV